MEKKSKISLIVTVAAVLLTVAAVVIINATKNTENAGGPGKGGGRGRGGAGNTIFTVRSAEAVKKTLNDYVITNGEVESQSAVEVFPSITVYMPSAFLFSTIPICEARPLPKSIIHKSPGLPLPFE